MARHPILLVHVAMRSEAKMDTPLLELTSEEGWSNNLPSLEGCRVMGLISGVGKVNAAAAIGYAFARLSPSALINVGYCASLVPELSTGSIVIPSTAVQYDYGHYEAGQRTVVRAGRPTIEGRKRPAMEAYFHFDARLRASLIMSLSTSNNLGEKIFRSQEVCVTSGDTFIADEAEARRVRDLTSGSILDMEAAAVAQVCAVAGVPAVAIKVVSDHACGNAREVYKLSLTDFSAGIAEIFNFITESADDLLRTLA